MAHRDGSGVSRVRVAPWLPSTTSGGRIPGPRHGSGLPAPPDDTPPVTVSAGPEPGVDERPPSLLRPVRLEGAGRRRGRWWFVVVPAAVIALLVGVAVQLRPGAEPDRPPLPQISPQVLPDLTPPVSAGTASAGPTASASPSASRRATAPPTATGRPGAGGAGTGAPRTTTPPPAATVAAVQPGSIVGVDGRCLEAEAARAGAAIRPAPCAASEKQKWSAPGDGTVRVQGFCLDVFFDRRDNGAPVMLYDCHGGGNQQWRIATNGWRNPQSGRCLTGVAAGLAISDCTGAANQRFSLT